MADTAAGDTGGITTPAATPSDVIPDIVVTAQKRAQSLQKVPMSVTALTASTLRQENITDIAGVAQDVPSLITSSTNGPGNQSYHLRGIGSDANIPTFEPDVALFIDGVYQSRSGLGVDDLVDLARIEVLEGPQSTLYGKNATAGVINIVTEAPSHHFEGFVEGQIADIEGGVNAPAYRLAASLSGPISNSVRVRVSGVSYNQGTTMLNLDPGVGNANNMHRYTIHAQLEADLAEATTLRLSFMRSETYDTAAGNPDLMYYADPGQAGGPNTAYKLDASPIAKAFGLGLCPDNNPTNRIICTTSPGTYSGFNNIASATLTQGIGAMTLTSITAVTSYQDNYQNNDISQLIVPVAGFTDNQSGGTTSEDLRLASPTGGKLDWMAGLYYLHTGFARGNGGNSPMFTLQGAAPYIPLPGGPLIAARTTCGVLICSGNAGDEGFFDALSHSDYYAGYGNLNWHISDKFVLSGGARYQYENQSASVDNHNTTVTPINLITAALTPVSANGAWAGSTGMFTWNATGEYHLDSTTMLYATVSRGGKAFGYNIGFGASPGLNRTYQNEYVTNYEGGVKSTLLNGRLRLSAAGWHADYTNYQNATYVGLQFLVDNAPKVSIDGAEGSASMLLAKGLTLNGAMTYTHASFGSYVNGPCSWPASLSAATCNVSGQRLPLNPDWRNVVSLDYHRDVSFGSLYARGDWTWQSSEVMDTNLDPRSVQSAYSLFNLHVGLKTKHGTEASLWVNNLFNKTYVVQQDVTNLAGVNDPAFQNFLGMPRMYGITLHQAF